MPNSRPVVLDLYCCQGGAARGYQQAGYRVVGVDIEDQPRYCGDEFWRADALGFLTVHRDWIRENVAFVHASPPCQGYSDAQVLRGNDHPMLISPTRGLLDEIGVPYVIENVPGARGHMLNPVELCGAAFGLRTYRHRLFEAKGFTVTPPPHLEHEALLTKMGRPRREGEFAHYVGNFSGVEEARADLGVPWMNRDGIRESIPPAYTELIGRQAAEQLQGARNAA